jgi:hypothetical protein
MGAMEASFWAQPHSTLTSAALITGHHLPILARLRSAERIQRQTIAGGNLQPKVTKSLTRWVVGCHDDSDIQPGHDLLRRPL